MVDSRRIRDHDTCLGEIRDPLKELRVIHPHERPKQRRPQDAEPALARFGVMELINP